MRQFHLYHAPWSKWIKTFALKGQYAYELQIGPLVLQYFYEDWQGRRLHAWKDTFWRRVKPRK